MSKQKNHIPGLIDQLTEYCEKRVLDFHQYSPYHMRIMDGGFVVLDVWTTGRYYVLMTDYLAMFDGEKIERAGEKGWIPTGANRLWNFLDELFYGEPMEDFSDIKPDEKA